VVVDADDDHVLDAHVVLLGRLVQRTVTITGGRMAREMSGEEYRSFVLEGTRTGGSVVFTTGATSTKAQAIRRDPRVALCVDDPQPPSATCSSRARPRCRTTSTSFDGGRPLSAAGTWAPRRADEFGARNAVPWELLVRITPTRVIAPG
jgi:hypothetical protein